MSRRKKKTRRHSSGYDRHHLIFQRAHYGKGYGLLLRRVFVREVPIEWHIQLHSLVHDCPKPPEEQLRRAWELYLENKDVIDSYGILDALGWLANAVPDDEWRWAMKTQLYFFRDKYNA